MFAEESEKLTLDYFSEQTKSTKENVYVCVCEAASDNLYTAPNKLIQTKRLRCLQLIFR